MKKNKDIDPINSNGQSHGYQEWYSGVSDKIRIRGTYKHGELIGYLEWHDFERTRFYIR